ncbi:MAG: tryptophan-rich sensory protein [Prochlorotrichaceae cyanobacterium]
MPLFTQSYSQRLSLSVFTLISIFGTLLVNTLSNFFPPKGLSIGEISRELFAEVLITPASYAFSIWGVIYIGLILYGFYQIRSDCRRDRILQALNIKLIVACFAQIAWVILFTSQQFGLSVLAIVIILGALVWAYLSIGQARQSNRRWSARHSLRNIDIPFSIYLAWIAVATIVNIACALTAAQWSGWGISPLTWTIVMLVISLALGLVALFQRHDYAFAAVILWAEMAIAVRHIDTLPLALTAGISALLLVGGILTHKRPRRGL